MSEEKILKEKKIFVTYLSCVDLAVSFASYVDKMFSDEDIFTDPIDTSRIDSKKIFFRTEDGRIFYDTALWFDYIFSKVQRPTEVYLGTTESQASFDLEDFMNDPVVPSVVIQYNLFSFMWFVSYIEEDDCYIFSEKFIDAKKIICAGYQHVSTAMRDQAFTNLKILHSEFFSQHPGTTKEQVFQSCRTTIDAICSSLNDKGLLKSTELPNNRFNIYSKAEEMLKFTRKENPEFAKKIEDMRFRNLCCQDLYFVRVNEKGKIATLENDEPSCDFYTGLGSVRLSRALFLLTKENIAKMSRKEFLEFIRTNKKIGNNVEFLCNEMAEYSADELLSLFEEYENYFSAEIKELALKIKSMDEKNFFPKDVLEKKEDRNCVRYFKDLFDKNPPQERILDEVLGISNYMKIIYGFEDEDYSIYIEPSLYAGISKEEALEKYLSLCKNGSCRNACAVARYTNDISYIEDAIKNNYAPACTLGAELTKEISGSDKEIKKLLDIGIEKNYPLALEHASRRNEYTDSERNDFLNKAIEIYKRYRTDCRDRAGNCRIVQYRSIMRNSIYADTNQKLNLIEAMEYGIKSDYIDTQFDPDRITDYTNRLKAGNIISMEEKDCRKQRRNAYIKYFSAVRNKVRCEEYIDEKLLPYKIKSADEGSVEEMENLSYRHPDPEPALYLKYIKKLSDSGDYIAKMNYAECCLSGKYDCPVDVKKSIELFKSIPAAASIVINIYLRALGKGYYASEIKPLTYSAAMMEKYELDLKQADLSEITKEEAEEFFESRIDRDEKYRLIMKQLYMENVFSMKGKNNAAAKEVRGMSRQEIDEAIERFSRAKKEFHEQEQEFLFKKSRIKSRAESREPEALVEYALVYLDYNRLRTKEGHEYISRAAQSGNERASAILLLEEYKKLSVEEKLEREQEYLEKFRRYALLGIREMLEPISKIYSDGTGNVFNGDKAFCFMELKKSADKEKIREDLKWQ